KARDFDHLQAVLSLP
ncbi:unnamed protein product, partial [Oikopleura dioica]